MTLSSRLAKVISSRHRLVARQRCFSTKHVPIAIVGGGPSGLLLSNLLSSYGTPSLLLEARSEAELFLHPQAHFLNTRTMEILRHSLPDLYNRTRAAMPPVEEWKYFTFGHSAAADSNEMMARVAHPVDQPLDAMADSNGVLLLEESSNGGEAQVAESPPPPTDPLSICSVGHLAQHTFSKLVYESAIELKLPETELQLGSPVTSIEWKDEDRVYKLTTKSGETIYAPIVIAADGANSRIRQAFKIKMKGQEGIQNLVNVHIRTSVPLSNAAMLYAIYNEDCVAMMVRHSAEEYVLQIPYFPPYQSIERDFTHNKVHKIVSKIMNSEEVDIVSIRSWTMSSLIASSYVDLQSGTGVLVGDAAHVFPPAGGFGMNTGLQDVHNLAWRLAAACRGNSNDSGEKDDSLKQHLRDYQTERQDIARQNAALSVRNFTRVLQLAKSCYLNDQHPTLLMKLLDAMPLLPLAVRQDMFSGLLRTALAPLASLRQTKSSWHARHVTANLRSILKQGGGLPLLFPKYELGFGYGVDKDDAKGREEYGSWKNDSLGYTPKVGVGHLLPHISVEVISGASLYPNLQWISDAVITTSDLPSQMRTAEPCFVLLVVEKNADTANQWENQLAAFRRSLPLGSKIVRVVKERPQQLSNELVLFDKSGRLHDMTSGIVAIRPDGHIWGIEEATEA